MSRVQVGTGLHGTGWYLEQRPGQLILSQELELPAEAVLGIIKLAEDWRAMRNQKAGYRFLRVRPYPDKDIEVRFTPNDLPGEKLREVELENGGRIFYMPVSTMLRLADALIHYRETGTLEGKA